MGGTIKGRLSPLLRWLGVTMIVVLVLQMVAVLIGVDWSADVVYAAQITGPLVAMAPLGFVGLLIMLIASRLDLPERRATPLRLVVFVVSTIMVIGMVMSIPISLGESKGELSQRQNLENGRQALLEAKNFREDVKSVKEVGEQLAQAGQLSPDSNEDDKRRAAELMIDEQIADMQAHISNLEAQQKREFSQRLIGGTASAAALAVAFTLMAFTAVS